MAQNNPVNDEWARRIRELWEWKQGFGGDFVRSTGKSVYVGSPPVPRRNREQRPANVGFWAEITGYAEVSGETNRWVYSWKRVRRTAYGWTDLAEYGTYDTGTTTERWAINASEANNSGSGVEGNGVDLDWSVFDDNEDLEVRPIRGNPVVRMYRDTDDEGNPCYTFGDPNGTGGDCAA